MIAPIACACDLDPRNRALRSALASAHDDRAGARSLLFFGGLFAVAFTLRAQGSDDPVWFWSGLKLLGTCYFWWIIALYHDARRRLTATAGAWRPAAARVVHIDRSRAGRPDVVA